MSRLLDCPKCGSAAEVDDEEDDGFIYVLCQGAPECGMEPVWAPNRDLACDKWNEAVVETLRSVIKPAKKATRRKR